MAQLKIPFNFVEVEITRLPYRVRLKKLLDSDLDFHGQNSAYASHALHPFPAKFPPQLPRIFIEFMTNPGDIVLDPMMGSGTTLHEAAILGRTAIGSDIDPLALRISLAKMNWINPSTIEKLGMKIIDRAQKQLLESPDRLRMQIYERFDTSSLTFIEYWFAQITQLELMALIQEIEKIEDPILRNYFTIVFSSVIITKSGGVSLARDLAHTRPHLVPDKEPREAVYEFRKRLKRNLQIHSYSTNSGGKFLLCEGDAMRLPLREESVDLVVTSPPYASNAIDYMRAHKFSLVWLGFQIDQLGELRGSYVGGESLRGIDLLPMPAYVDQILQKVMFEDKKKSQVLHRYYSEMYKVLSEMHRLLKPGRAAIIVVGTSTMRGIDTETHKCLGEIGKKIGFELVDIGIRRLDRDKRMMPARLNAMANTQIEARMHEEYVIGFLK